VWLSATPPAAILAAALAARERPRVAALLLLGLPAFPDEATARAQIGRLGLLARMTVEGHDLARLVCQAMCMLRPLAVTLGPLVMRDLPPTVVADGARHTWPSYSRTLEEVVVGHRPLPDVVAAAVPTVVAHGREDRVAPVDLAEALAAAARQRGASVTLRLLAGDHHLAVRRPAAVAEVLASLRSPSTSGGEGGAATA
jgi:pimeloyl-ACP methyl ester carboxylesterase